MDKQTIENKIKELKTQIKRDERMMEEEPQSMYWWQDHRFNSSLLSRYEGMLSEGDTK